MGRGLSFDKLPLLQRAKEKETTKDNVGELSICSLLEFQGLGNCTEDLASSFPQNRDEEKQDIYGKFTGLR